MSSIPALEDHQAHLEGVLQMQRNLKGHVGAAEVPHQRHLKRERKAQGSGEKLLMNGEPMNVAPFDDFGGSWLGRVSFQREPRTSGPVLIDGKVPLFMEC